MVDVFVSYSVGDDQRLAESLRDHLALNYGRAIKPILAADFRSDAEEGAAKVQRLISRCQVFVVFYTTKGSENQWVNQELGYAMALSPPNGIRIIPIYDRREDFAGMLHTRIDNLAGQFKLHRGKEIEVWREVGGFILGEFQAPLSLDTRMHKQARAGSLIFDLHLSNTLQRSIMGATVHFITPPGVEAKSEKKPTPFAKYLDGIGELIYQNQPLALPLRQRIYPVPPLDIDDLRTMWILLDEFPMASGAQRIELLYPQHLKAFTIAIVSSVPFSEPAVYELPVDLTEGRWYLSKLRALGTVEKANISCDPPT